MRQASSVARSHSFAAERYPFMDATPLMGSWPAESREAAELVIKKYGQPDEATESTLMWNRRGPWKRIVAYREFSNHNFPAPHIDAIESFIDFSVPPDKVSDLNRFDGSVVVNRTRGELSARCHDEEANFLALNLAHDIIDGKRTVDDARRYYGQEFLNYRKKAPTPYMQGLKFDAHAGEDPDERILSDEDLKRAKQEGERAA
jgi:hypothetical protein